MNNKPAKQKQPNTFSENWATIPPKKDLSQHRSVSQFRQFNASKVSKKALKDYLEFCSKIFPNGENGLGIMFNDDIKESRALAFLASQNYDLVKAKFYLAFPVLYRSIKAHRLNVEITEMEMKSMLDEFRKQKNPNFVNKETGFFERMLARVEGRREKVPIQEVRELLNEAAKLKYDVPSTLKQEFAQACQLEDRITGLLQASPKAIADVDALLDLSEMAIVVPVSVDRLRTLKARIEELVHRSTEFLANTPKDAKIVALLLSEVRGMGVNPEQVPQFVHLRRFNEELQEMLALYRIIRRSGRGPKEPQGRTTFLQYYALVNFLIDNQVMEQERVNDLIDFVNEKIRQKETCQLFLEDDRNRDGAALLPIIADLGDCTLDFSRICQRVNEKLETLRTLDALALNIDNEKELFKNIELLQTHKKKGLRLYRAEVAGYEKILAALSRIDDIVVDMNTIELNMEQFLFENVKLPSYNELKGLLELDYTRERRANNYLRNMNNFLDSYTAKLDEYYTRQGWTIQELYESVQELVAFILQDDVKLPHLKTKLLKALIVEFEIVRFLDKFTNTRFRCTYEYWNSRIVESARVFNDIKAGFDYFLANEVVRPLTEISVHYPNLLIVYEQYRSITSFVQESNLENLSPENVEQLEEMLTGLVNDPVHNNMLESAKQMNNIKVLLASFDQHKSGKYIEHDDLMQNIQIISPDTQKSKEFLRKHFSHFMDIYRECQGFNICIDEKDITEISLYFKRMGPAELEKWAPYRHSIEEMREVIERNLGVYKDYQKFVNKDEDSFVLKFPLYVVILFKLSSLGIETSYCAEIRVFVKHYLELMDFMDLKNKKTLREMLDLSGRLADVKAYLPVFDRFKALLPFARTFVEQVSVVETAFRGNMVTSCEVAHNLLKKVKAKDYTVRVAKDGIFLKKRSASLFENADFKEQMTAQGKKLKKAKTATEGGSADEVSARPLSKPATKILPIVFNQTEQEYCLCREKYEIIGSSMLKYNKCDEWFHRECLKLPNYRTEKVHEDHCLACDFLEGRLSPKLEAFLQGKVEEAKYLEVFNSSMYLKNYLLDEKVDFIDYVHKKIKRMTEGLDLFVNEIDNLNEKTRKSRVHNLALLYLYLPVRIENIEATLIDIHKVDN